MAEASSIEKSILALLATDQNGVKQKVSEYIAAQAAAEAKIAEATAAQKSAEAAIQRAEAAQAKADEDAANNASLQTALKAALDGATNAKADAEQARLEFVASKSAHDAKAAELVEKHNAADKLRADLSVQIADAQTLQAKLTKARDTSIAALREVGL